VEFPIPTGALVGPNISSGTTWGKIRRDRLGMWAETGDCKNREKCTFSFGLFTGSRDPRLVQLEE